MTDRRWQVVLAVLCGTAALTACSLTSTPSQAPVTVTVTPSSSAAPSSSPAASSGATSPTSSPSASVPSAVTSAAKAPPSWASTFAKVSTGVVRIDSICTDDDKFNLTTGTGFLIAPNMVATVAHVVEGEGGLRITSPTTGLVVPGEVIGVDHDDDIALIRTADPLSGHVFDLPDRTPAIGTEMAAIGFPLGRSMQLTVGRITGTHDHRSVEGGYDLDDVLLTDAALNHGNSGGPWITIDGDVVGLDESGPPYDQDEARAQGNNGGVSAATAFPRLLGWLRTPEPAGPRTCEPTSATGAAEESLELYFDQIDNSDYASAYAQLDSDNHPISNLDSFVSGVESSTDAASDGSGAYFSVAGSGQIDGQTYLDVQFRSHQRAAQGPDDETCTDWSLRYIFVAYRGLQIIHSTPPTPGSDGHVAC